MSLKVDTFTRMLTDIYTDLRKKEKERGASMSTVRGRVKKSFFRSGLICGEAFGKELVEEIWKGGEDISTQEKLDKWCKFDSDVGFGNFSSNDIKIDSKKHVTSGKIILKNNFLASRRKHNVPHLCDFMVGYVNGVLKKVLDANVVVTHKAKDCIQGKPDKKKECDFYFRRVE
ncbi:MAG: hypothetical protein QME42_07225 [bacterium]|nr:hypothetical protein [bacterium]